MKCEILKNPEEVYLNDFNLVVCDYKKTELIMVHHDLGESMTLYDLRRSHSDAETITVISDGGTSGVVYKFGNHGKIWERTGETCGYY